MQEKPNPPEALDYESPPRKEKHAAWIILATAVVAVIVVLTYAFLRSEKPAPAQPPAATARP